MRKETLSMIQQKFKGSFCVVLINYAKKIGKSRRMILDTFDLPKLSQEDVQWLNKPVTSNEIKSVIIKSLPTKKS
jgi:hypothetical protein